MHHFLNLQILKFLVPLFLVLSFKKPQNHIIAVTGYTNIYDFNIH